MLALGILITEGYLKLVAQLGYGAFPMHDAVSKVLTD